MLTSQEIRSLAPTFLTTLGSIVGVQGARAIDIISRKGRVLTANEDGLKSVTLVTVREDRSSTIEERPTSIAQFERIEFDASSVEGWADLIDGTSSLLEAKRSQTSAEHLVARIYIKGSTPLAWRIRRDLDLLKTELETNSPDRCWIEKIEVSCLPRSVQIVGVAADHADPLMELRDLIQSDVLNSDALITRLTAIADELKGQRLREAASDARNARLFERGTQLRQGLSQDWRDDGSI